MVRRIGPYVLEQKLGEGGMGVVYSATDPRLGRRVAIKTIHREAADATARQRLWREARAAAAIHHPRICQVHEVGEEEGEIYLVMELLEGEPLSARLGRGPLPLGEALDTGIAVLETLDAVHRGGLVHRDLKPGNVFLTPHGVKLLDFGLALPLEAVPDGERLTRPGVFLGTPGYMAPEQWLGEDIGPATDLFAVGALLVEMITGTPAFTGRNAAECLHAVLNRPAPALTGGAAVEAANRVVQQALSKEPADRPPSAARMADDLRGVRAQVDGTERPAAVPLQRLAVLPFRLLREDQTIDFLPVGLADALTTSLSGIDGLAVTSGRVAARFGANELDLPGLARETGAQLALTGTLLRAGDRLRVHAELLHVSDGSLAWSDTAEVEATDVFRLQDDLGRHIVDSLALRLAPGRRRSLQADVPKTPRAYEFFLRANQVSYNFGQLATARDLYRACLAEDPRYAPAWARLGRVYRVMAKYGHGDIAKNTAAAAEAFRKALALSPDLASAHHQIAYYEIEELGRPQDALVRLLKQVARAPTSAELWAGLVTACRFCGLLDASVEADRHTRRLDPGLRTSVAYTYWMRGEYETALAHDDEDMGWMHYYCLPRLGRAEEAIALCRERERRSTEEGERNVLACDRAGLEGNREDCERAARNILGSGFRDPEGRFFATLNLTRVKSWDLALEFLEDLTARGFFLPDVIATEECFAPLRGKEGFARALEHARAGHAQAREAYRAAGGEPLLGPLPA